MPTNVAARMTLAADPGRAPGRGRGGDPRRRAGAARARRRSARSCWPTRASAAATRPRRAAAVAAEIRAAGGKVPGFGHPVHKPLDPRAERILALADERGVAGEHVALARALRDGVAAAWGRPLVMNVSMPIAAVLLDLGLRRADGQGDPDPRADRLAARPPRRGARRADRLPDGGSRRARGRTLRAHERRARASRSPTCSSARPSTARSSPATTPAGPLEALPLTTKQELRATVSPEYPFGTHCCVDRGEIARIYSTSGHDGHAELHPAHRGRRRQLGHGLRALVRALGRAAGRADRQHLQRRARSPRARRSPPSTASGSATCRSGPGTPSGSSRAIQRPRARGGRDDALLRRLRGSSGRRSAGSTSRPPPCGACSSPGEPGGGEPGFRARLEAGWGARVTEAMGIGDIGVSLWGECEAQDGMHLGAAEFVHPELIDPATGAAVAHGRTARRASSCSRTSRHRAAPLLRFRTRDHVRVRAGTCACGRDRDPHPLHRAHGRHAHRARRQRLPVRDPRGRRRVRAAGQRQHRRAAAPPRARSRSRRCRSPSSWRSDAAGDAALAAEIRERLRAALVVQTAIELVPYGSLQRSEYKSRLVLKPSA